MLFISSTETEDIPDPVIGAVEYTDYTFAEQ